MGYKFTTTDKGPQIQRPDGVSFTVNNDTNVYKYENVIVLDLVNQNDIELKYNDIDTVDAIKPANLDEAFELLRKVFNVKGNASNLSNMVETPDNKMVKAKITGDAFNNHDLLPANASVTTGWLDISNYDSLKFVFFSDVLGSYKIEYSSDKQNIVLPAIEVLYDEPGLRRKGAIDPDASFVRVTFKNGNQPQTKFAMIVSFKIGLTQPSLEILGATGSKTRLAQWVKAAMHIMDASGAYDDVFRVGNSLSVHVDNQTAPASSVAVSNIIHAIIDALPAITLATGQSIEVNKIPAVTLAPNQIVKAVIDALPAISIAPNQTIAVSALPAVALATGTSVKVSELPAIGLAANQSVNIGSMPAVSLASGQTLKLSNDNASPVPVALTNTDYAKDGTDITGSAIPAGGVGIRGWLSAIYQKIIAGLPVIAQAYPLKFRIQPSGSGGNFQVVKSAAGTIGTIIITNTGTSTITLMLYDKSTIPTSADSPDQAIPIQAGQTVPIRFEGGMSFANGIGIGFLPGTGLTNIVAGLLTLITAGTITVNINYK